MLIQQNNGPLVVLALILLALAVLVGILLSGTEIVNPTERIQMASIAGTRAALENQQTAAMIAATQTPLAAIVQATAVPLQQTATHHAAIATQEAIVAESTRMAISNEVQATRQAISAEATRTQIILDGQMQEINQEAQRTQTTNLLTIILAVVIGLAVLTIVAAGAYILVQRQKAQAAAHAARAYAEQRRLFIVQAAMKEQENRHSPNGKPANGRSQPTLHPPDLPNNPRRPSA